jgi:hypothetical protein
MRMWTLQGFGPGPHQTAPEVQSGLGCGPQLSLEVQFGVWYGFGILCTWSELDCTLDLLYYID